MQQNQWLVERLTEEHKRELMAQAEKARQAESVRQVSTDNQSQNLLQKLRSELMSLSNRSQDVLNERNR